MSASPWEERHPLDARFPADGDPAELIAATARGDRDAFRALYDATAPKLFGIILRIIRNRPVAEEILQETYIRVWQSAERFAPEAGHPLAWLSTIARNRAIDRLRAETFERGRVGDDDVLNRIAAPGGGDPADREALRTCLDGLEREARDCVVLAYCSGLSREELADRFGRPVGTIKTILHRAIGLLRACLERE
jgi:RNA polymerase sigma-70 factor (ECF subfamily)